MWSATIRMVSVVGLACWIPAKANAEPILLHVVETSGGSSASPAASGEIEVVFRHQTDDGAQTAELGRGRLWNDGESGFFDFTRSDSPVFEQMATGLTNGEDDFITLLLEWPGVGGGGITRTEAEFGFGEPDLAAFEVTSIRLVVEDLNIVPWENGYMAQATWSYEFYGTIIPEPATVVLFGLCASVLLRRRSRRDWFQSK